MDDVLGAYVAKLALQSMSLYAFAEVLGKWMNIDKARLTVIMGAILGVVLHGATILVAPGAGWWAWAIAVIGGLFSGGGASLFAAHVVNPVVKGGTPEVPE